MHPGELDLLLGELRADLGAAESVPDEATKEFFEVLDRLRRDWRCAWSVYAEDESGWPQYRSLIQRALDQAERVDGDLPMASNGTPAKNVLNSTLGAALNPGLKPSQADPTAATVAAPAAQAGRPAFERPVFIVAAPRSGSTLLFETMARNRGLWTIGGESHQEFEAIPGLNPANSLYHSNRLTEADADPATAATLMDAFAAKLQHADGNQLHQYPQEQRPTAIRFLEKTPKNALRIPFLRAVFPDALFVFFHRNPRDNISSIIDAWGSGRFVTYPELSGWMGPPWSLLLPPGWRELNGASIGKIAAFQWRCANQQILDDLADLPNQCWISVSYEEFLADPQAQARRLCDFIDVPFGARMQAVTSGKLPNSRYTLTPPDPEKWRKNEKEVTAVLPELEELAAQLRSLGR